MKPTVPAPHPLAELIAQMLTGVAHVPRVEQARMVADAAKAAAKWRDARVAELECRIAKQTKMNHDALRAEIVNYRAIRPGDLCKRCSGMGVRAYGSTATWRGGMGGQAITSDVCDQCWGSGSTSRPWPSRKEQRERDKQVATLTARVAELEAERDRLREALGAVAKYREFAEGCEREGGKAGINAVRYVCQLAAAALAAKEVGSGGN